MNQQEIGKQILDSLISLSDKKSKRVDKYIQNLKEYLKQVPGWEEQHESVFREMLKEVRTSRLVGLIFLYLAFLLIIFSVAYFFSSGPTFSTGSL